MLLPSAFISVFGWYPQEHSPFSFRSPTHSGGGWTFALTHLIPGQEWTSHLSIMFPPNAIKCFHTHVSHLSPPFFCSLQSRNEQFSPRTPPLCPCLIPEAQLSRPPTPLFFFPVLSVFIPMLLSSLVILFYFLPPPFSPPKPGHRRPTGTYLVFLHPHSGLRANCRVWSVCKLIEISHSSPHLRLASPCLNLGREGWSVTFSLCNPFDRDQERSVGFRLYQNNN